MLKEGSFHAIRNILVGWTMQAVHSTDVSERIFRIILEFFLFIIFTQILISFDVFESLLKTVIYAFIVTHTITWFITGNFWVYILDSFKFMKNPGINSIISFLKITRRLLLAGDYCNSIMIYGSMCRSNFHIRSDLDLRIIRRSDSWVGFLTLPIAYLLRVYSFFIMLPLDLQVVDSMKFLEKQMRRDERPIIVYCRKGFEISNTGTSFSEIESNPASIFKEI
jgi:hypothetical protein